MKDQCFLLGDQPRVFIQLGRYGDLILLLPAFLRMRQLTGVNPIVMVSTEFQTVLDGASYVTPLAVHWDWYGGMPNARRLAQELYGGATILQCNGTGWDAAAPNCPNYMTSIWRRTGFTDEEMRTLPLVFDRRDAGREANLVRMTRRREGKPLLLVNFEGQTSRMPAHPEVMRVITEFARDFQIVDLGAIRAVRIYDLLGLYDAAAGLVTIDTATLHLAPGSGIPYVGYTADGSGSSVVKGNCALEIKYRDAVARLADLRRVLAGWAGREEYEPMAATPGGRGALRI